MIPRVVEKASLTSTVGLDVHLGKGSDHRFTYLDVDVLDAVFGKESPEANSKIIMGATDSLTIPMRTGSMLV